MDTRFLEPCFLGPQGENLALFEQLLLEFVRDHAYWRRNFHPEDGAEIPSDAALRPEYAAFVARMRDELMKLGADLKRAVPFFSPRYVGHMSADLLMPGVLAKMVTTLYNPNNVSEEAAPVTLEKELEVGRDLARMFGMNIDETKEPCAWGHLTAGGTTANYEALWNLRSVKLYPIALAEGVRAVGLHTGKVGPKDKPLLHYSKWELLNLSLDDIIQVRNQIVAVLKEQGSKEAAHHFSRFVKGERIETLGAARFFQKHGDLKPPVVLVPSSAHYSWQKGMKVLGLGTANLVKVDIDDEMRMCGGHLEQVLEATLGQEIPVLCCVGVLGTTEFGAIDPIHEIVQQRDDWRAKGCDFGIHVDAAWGGYYASVFRTEDGGLLPRDELNREYTHFPSETVYNAFASLGAVDSITVDPHKLGFIPYAAGAFIARNRRVVDFITQEAAYVFDLENEGAEIPMGEKLRNLGQYILEGSKSGATAAAVHVTHRVLPLHHDGFGKILRPTILAAERFVDLAGETAERLKDLVTLKIPFITDTDVVCLAVNPKGNTDLTKCNAFNRALFAGMKVDRNRPVQSQEFIGSYTSLTASTLPDAQRERVLGELGLPPAALHELPEDGTGHADHLFLLRHTLMNPWLLFEDEAGTTWVERYWVYLEQRIREELGKLS